MDNSLNISVISDSENEAPPAAFESMVVTDSQNAGPQNYLLFARTHIKYIDAETKLAQRERAWEKERKSLQDRIQTLMARPADVSLLDHESTALAENVQRLEKENGRLKQFKEKVQNYIFQAKDSNESSIIVDMISELIDV